MISDRSVKVGICGLGTVGSGTLSLIQQNFEEISTRARAAIEVVHIGARRDNPTCDTSDIRISRDIFEVARDPQVDVLVELIGGIEPAKTLLLEAIANGKHVVTANKALIAEHGNELFRAAEEQGVFLSFDAAVAGAIPVIGALREGLAANQIRSVAGIINGTANFILTEMRDHGRVFEDVLREAQAKGYAEADPTFDVEGVDTAHKLTILASIAFGIPLKFDEVFTEGIGHLQRIDVQFAEELGYGVKHLGIARRVDEGVEIRVHPTLISHDVLLAHVDGVMNAIWIDGDASGPTLFYGAGAGSLPTASAVVADIVEIARNIEADGIMKPHLGVVQEDQKDLQVLPISECITGYYMRITALDKPGVMLSISRILTDAGVSIDAMIQKEAEPGASHVPLVLITSPAKEAILEKAVAKLEALEEVVEPVIRIRVEDLEK